ncbi:MAG: hypothetical protein WAL25_16415, partial [Acidimicrobiia bacterium]
HWMGPVVGAVIIYTLSDRLNSAGLTDVNQIIIGSLLVVLALSVREGVYVRMRERWVTTIVTFGGVMALVTILGINDSLISDFAYAMVATVLLMLVPDRLWDRMWRRGGGSGPPADAPQELAGAGT